MDSDFYKYFGLSNADSKFKNNQEVYNLFKTPKKDKKKQSPIFYNFEKDNTHQADLLFLPNDKGYKYCLCVVDIATGLMDAEPLKEKTSESVLNAFKKIYSRKILSLPHKIIVDSGSEFQGKVSDYMKKEEVNKKTAETARHRSLAVVEKRNQILGKVLFMKMHAQELLTGKLNLSWVKDLPDIITKINEKYGHKPLDDNDLYKKYGDPWQTTQHLLPIGTRVRVQLNQPRDIVGNKLHGRFRGMDTRWTNEIYKIKSYLFDPHEPVLYILDKKYKEGHRISYTRNQLQVVSENEQEPPAKMILDQPKGRQGKAGKKNETFIIKKILNKRIIGKKNEYLIWWKGYPKTEATWEPENNLPVDIVKEFNQN
jgi:hypothetical protein